jgi:transcriptional regulator with XRE-family HTH domain
MSWLKTRRKQLNISQETLARYLQLVGVDITAGSISHWENGRHKIPLDNQEFRDALGVCLELTPTELLQMAGYEVSDDDNENAVRINAIVNNLPDDIQQMALEYMELLNRRFGKSIHKAST